MVETVSKTKTRKRRGGAPFRSLLTVSAPLGPGNQRGSATGAAGKKENPSPPAKVKMDGEGASEGDPDDIGIFYFVAPIKPRGAWLEFQVHSAQKEGYLSSIGAHAAS